MIAKIQDVGSWECENYDRGVYSRSWEYAGFRALVAGRVIGPGPSWVWFCHGLMGMQSTLAEAMGMVDALIEGVHDSTEVEVELEAMR